MQRLARKFDAQLNFQSGSVIGELKAPCPTPISVMRELVADGCRSRKFRPCGLAR
jgi:hypothetical protein